MTKKSKFICIAALAAMMTTPAFAGGPLAVCESGVPFRWENDGQNIPFNPDQGALGPVSAADAVALVDASFQVWEDVGPSAATYTNAGVLPVDVDITNFGPFLNPTGPDGLSAIVFDDTGEIFDLLFGPGSGILGFAGPEFGDTAACTITEGVSFLNGPSFTDLTAAFDVMVHEFGHYSNLAHTVVNGQQFIGAGDTSGPSPNNTFGTPDPTADTIETMYPFYFGPGSGTNTPHRDDIASLSTLYPDPSFATDFGSISGSVLAPNGVTRLTGVNVIARNIADPFNDAVSAISSDFTDATDQSDPVVGTYLIEGLTPGADYAVYIDEVLAGGFSTTLLTPLPGPEEFFNGANESSIFDDPTEFTPITIAAGGDASGTDIIFNSPAPGTPLPVGDDGNVQVFLPFTFEICNVEFDSVFINANGNLTFGAPSGDFSESVADLIAGPPRIAGLWDDLNPNAGGTVSFDQTAGAFTVTWDGVPEFFSTGSNTFSITLNDAGNFIDLVYGDLSATDGLAGVTCGSAFTAGNETGIDLSAGTEGRSRWTLRRSAAVFELFDGSNPNDLAQSTVGFNPTVIYRDRFEPNDSFASARTISVPFNSSEIRRYTELSPTGGDVDFFRFRARAGTTLIAEVAAGQLDSVLGLFDSAGNLVAADDDGGAGLLSRIVFPIPADGDYIVAVSAFPDFGFTGAGGSGGRYVLDLAAIRGTPIALGDDDSEEVAIGFTFPFQGTDWSSVWVNSNGNLTFGSGDTDFSESVAELLSDQPRIAALWDDLSPNQGGMVIVDNSDGRFTVTFRDVPEFFASTTNSFAVSLSRRGSVSISYDGIASTDSIVGVTQGGGVADPGATDLSLGGPFSSFGTTYEEFSFFGSGFDLDGTRLDFN